VSPGKKLIFQNKKSWQSGGHGVKTP